MIPNLETLQILDTQFSAAFKAGISKATERWDLIATKIPSKTRLNTYAWLGDFPKMREWVGDRVIQGLAGKSYQLENKDFELTLGVPRKDIEDDQFGIYMPMAEQMGKEVAEHPARLVYETLKNGGEATSLCYDDQPFFSTAHPVGDSTASNDTAGGGDAWYVLDTTQVLKPLIYQERRAAEIIAKNRTDDDNMFWEKQAIWGADGRYVAGYSFWQLAHRSKATLSDTNLNAVRRAMRELTDDKGRPLNLQPNLLIVPPSLESTADKLINQLALASGETNMQRGKYQLVVSSFVM
jgi:phage major head subunit gpT-like protein